MALMLALLMAPLMARSPIVDRDALTGGAAVG
jgi:hypothetical protein